MERIRNLRFSLNEADIRAVDVQITEAGHKMDGVVAEITVKEMAELGCYWLPDEDAADAEVATQLMFKKLRYEGYQITYSEVQEAVVAIALPGPALPDLPTIEVVFRPQLGRS